MDYGIEIVDAYEYDPSENKEEHEARKKANAGKEIMQYSLHVYNALWDADMRGIRAQKKSNGWWILMNKSSNYDPEEERRVIFPCFDSPNAKKKRAMITQIGEKFIEFIEQKRLSGENLIKKTPSQVIEKLEKLTTDRNKNPKYKGK